MFQQQLHYNVFPKRISQFKIVSVTNFAMSTSRSQTDRLSVGENNHD